MAKKFNVKLVVPKSGEVKISHDTLPETCQTFQDFVLHYGYFPTSGNRWCSIWCKQRVMKAYWRTRFNKHIVLYKLNGVRMFESKTRLWKYGNPKHYKRFSVDGSYFLRYDNEHHPCILVYPIIEWTTEDVLEFLKQNNVVLHGGYKVFGVSGCKWCPVHDRETFKKIMQKYPDIYDDFIEMENKINRPAIQGKFWLRDLKKELSKKRKK
jgi:3'-phosphoadenosine 5'-phosphosulfate sulfotransferase (PAPS reductase)/FAD synthetase